MIYSSYTLQCQKHNFNYSVLAQMFAVCTVLYCKSRGKYLYIFPDNGQCGTLGQNENFVTMPVYCKGGGGVGVGSGPFY